MVLPFVLLLGAIAVLPLVPGTHWWESNLHRFYVAGGLGAITLSIYLFVYERPVESHWPVEPSCGAVPGRAQRGHGGGRAGQRDAAASTCPFIVLLFSLYTISGGIRIEGDLPAHPLTNAVFLGVGGLLASFIGTTGAAMLLIRPLLETNRERKHVAHTVVFFIFIVCNCGGCLLPLGDPPLFLGYLMGVPFLLDAAALEGVAVRQRRAAGDLLSSGTASGAIRARRPRDIAPRRDRGRTGCGSAGCGRTPCCCWA